jgi:glycosyltransferase involved in cell wall biosynthesis
MRIAFFSVSDQMGGSEVMLLQTAAELRRCRPAWQLHLVLPGPGPLGDRAAALGMRVAVLPMPVSLSRFGESGLGRAGRGAAGVRIVRAALDLPAYERRLRDLLSEIRPDVIHTNGFKAHILASRTRGPHSALVWHMHEYISMRPLTRRLLRHYADRCAVVVANSESVGADVRTVLGRRAQVRVIYNAVDLDRFAPDGPMANLDALAHLDPAPAGTVRVGLIATFSRWKGHETFLRAVAALPASTGVRAYIIGGALYDTDGSQYSVHELRAFAVAHGLESRVGFTGFVQDSASVMRSLDIVVHASTAPEPFGLVIAEAMACGRALVTSATGGAAELVRAGEDALTHRPGNVADLTAAIQGLAGDPAARARLGRAARATAARRYDARRLADEFIATYATAAAKKHVNRRPGSDPSVRSLDAEEQARR